MSFVSVSHLSRKYGDIVALDDFSIEVDKGDIVSVVGPDGAGKTTLMRIMCNLLDADKGEVHIDGLNVSTDFGKVKTLVGYMPQSFSLYSDLSIEENLVFYAGIFGYTGKAFTAKRDALYGFSRLGPFARRRAGALSGGMKQKLALSCALIHDPQLLILDEPTTGVDPLSRRSFWEMLAELRSNGVTIIVSTPYMDEAARSDRTVCVFDGRKLAEGSPEDLAGEFRGKVYYIDREPSSNLAEQLSSLEGLTVRRFGSGMQAYLEPGHTIESHIQGISGMGVDPAAIKETSPTLEDRFIQMMEGVL